MAHSADLIRAIFSFGLSFILPLNFIRYFFHILMLLIGALGMFFLLKEIGFKNKKYLAFIGGIFYVLNFGTIQIFYLPFEAFSIFFAGLPWQILIFLKFITNSENKLNKKLILKLFLINLLFTPQSYVQTLFFVYILIISIISFLIFIKNRKLFIFNKTLIAFLIIFIVNSFWIFPQIYFLKTNNNVVATSKINQLATEDVYFQNKEKGDVASFVKMEGFYYELKDDNQKFIFANWKNYFNNKPIFIIKTILFLIIILGLFSKNTYTNLFRLLFLFISLFFLNNTPIFSSINEIIRKSEFLNQIFRSPFTKIIIPYSFISSILLVLGIEKIIKKFQFNKLMSEILTTLFLIIIIINTFPIFSGNLFSQTMKVNIPKEYLETINLFKKIDKNQRIALLPEYTFWGWFNYKWGYNGSGFLWYGIEQPIVSRTFDVWNAKNEGYFWEIKQALESENIENIIKIFKKYQINYVIIDKSLNPVSLSEKALQTDRDIILLNKTPDSKKILENKYLIIYKIGNEKINYFENQNNLFSAGPEIKITNLDSVYLRYGNYKVNENNPDLYFPFLDLFSQTNLLNKKWKISKNNTEFIIQTKLPFNIANYKLVDNQVSNEARIYNSKFLSFYETQIKNNELTIKVPITKITNFSSLEYTDQNCAKDTNLNCFGFNFPLADQKYGYLLTINSKNISGRNLFYSVLDETKKQSIIENRITNSQTFIFIPPKYQYGLGYSVSFQSSKTAQNILSNINLNLFPFENIKNIYFVKNNFEKKQVVSSSKVSSKKYSYYLYKVTPNNSILIFNQTYDKGWVLIDSKNIFNIKKSFLVNNWANGWEIENPQNTYYVFYWPQLLEYLGFALILAILGFLVKYTYEDHNHS